MEIKNEAQASKNENLLHALLLLEQNYLKVRKKIETFIADTPTLFYQNFPANFSENEKSALKILVNTFQERVIRFLSDFENIENEVESLKHHGIKPQQYKALFISINAFCLHILYIFLNFNHDSYGLFKQLCYKLLSTYKDDYEFAHENAENEKLTLLWFRHYFEHLMRSMKHGCLTFRKKLFEEYNQAYKLYIKFSERTKFLTKAQLMVNQISISLNKSLEEYYSDINSLPDYFKKIINLHEYGLSLKPAEGLTQEVKIYLHTGLFFISCKKLIFERSFREFKKPANFNFLLDPSIQPPFAIFQNNKYHQELLNILQLKYKEYQIDEALTYVKNFRPPQRKLIGDPLLYGSTDVNNLTPELFFQTENFLNISVNIALLSMRHMSWKTLEKFTQVTEFAFYTDLVSLIINSIGHHGEIYQTQTAYPEYYDINDRIKKQLTLKDKVKDVELMLAHINKLKLDLIKRNIKAEEMYFQLSSENNQTEKNHKKSTQHQKKRKKKKQKEKIKKILEKAHLDLLSENYESALNLYKSAAALLQQNTAPYLSCLKNIACCYSLLAESNPNLEDKKNNLVNAKENYELMLTHISLANFPEDICNEWIEQCNSNLNNIQQKLKKIELQIKAITPAMFKPTENESNLPIYNHHIELNSFEKEIIDLLTQNNYFVFIVGGRVKDHLTGQPYDDTDIVAFRLLSEEDIYIDLYKLLEERNYTPRKIGKDYKVIRVAKDKQGCIDINDISVKINLNNIIWQDTPTKNIYEILLSHARLCDYTIDTIFYDPINLKLIDPLNGSLDLKNKRLRSTGPEVNPNNLLRAIRFITKYELEIPDFILDLSQNSDALLKLDKEKIYLDINKLFLNGFASKSFKLLADLNLLHKLFPLTAEASTQSNLFKQLLTNFCTHTDKLSSQKAPLSAAFLFSVFLWGPVNAKLSDAQQTLSEITSVVETVLNLQESTVCIPEVIKNRIKTILLIVFYGFENIRNEYKEFSYKFADIRLAQELVTFLTAVKPDLEPPPTASYK